MVFLALGRGVRIVNACCEQQIQVPRHVLKKRLGLFWTTMFRIRQLAVLVLGYEPTLLNFDQSPYHHNESGSQNKPTLGIRGSTSPVVEGNSDVRSRWTANLTTCSRSTRVSEGVMPPAECMFKGNKRWAGGYQVASLQPQPRIP